jgi:hypothetical protein
MARDWVVEGIFRENGPFAKPSSYEMEKIWVRDSPSSG